MGLESVKYVCLVCGEEVGPSEITVIFERRGRRLRRRVEHRHVHDAVVEVRWNGRYVVMRPLSAVARMVLESVYG